MPRKQHIYRAMNILCYKQQTAEQQTVEYFQNGYIIFQKSQYAKWKMAKTSKCRNHFLFCPNPSDCFTLIRISLFFTVFLSTTHTHTVIRFYFFLFSVKILYFCRSFIPIPFPCTLCLSLSPSLSLSLLSICLLARSCSPKL